MLLVSAIEEKGCVSPRFRFEIAEVDDVVDGRRAKELIAEYYGKKSSDCKSCAP